MSLTARRIIFYCLLSLFIVTAPIIIGYTAGYRYSIKQRRIVTTGIISAQSNPEQARIYLNKSLYKDRTPTLITNLTPGSYNIEISRDGFHSWNKTLNVQSEQTTFTGSVILFKKDTEPLPILDIPKKVYSTRPKLITFNAHEVWYGNPKTQERKLITRLLEKINDAIPLQNDSAVLLILPNRIRALELDLRDRQNFWDLAIFDEIKTAVLAEDGKTLFIEGARDGRTGAWALEL